MGLKELWSRLVGSGSEPATGDSDAHDAPSYDDLKIDTRIEEFDGPRVDED